jgi:hypothetical protein
MLPTESNESNESNEHEFATWKPLSPEEIAEMQPGEEVVVFLSEWKKGKRLNHYRKAEFVSYSPGRGLVTVNYPYDGFKSFIENSGITESSVCEANVGRCLIPEHFELHGDFSYDE